MNKVYIVFQWRDYEQMHILEVFSSKEKAEEYINSLTLEEDEYSRYQEYTVN